MTILKAVEGHVFSARSTEELFNPYRDLAVELDRPEAPAIRRENLRRYIADHDNGVELLLIAEAPGPWGCRFSGVPITSEAQLLDPFFPAGGVQSSLRKEPYSEYSANIFWRILRPYYASIFVWNTVPLHPYRKGDPLSIRTPRQSEINLFLPVLEEIARAINPPLLLAIGRKAENALNRIGLEPRYVRHPSQGGARAFEEGVRLAVRELGLSPTDQVSEPHG